MDKVLPPPGKHAEQAIHINSRQVQGQLPELGIGDSQALSQVPGKALDRLLHHASPVQDGEPRFVSTTARELLAGSSLERGRGQSESCSSIVMSGREGSVRTARKQ